MCIYFEMSKKIMTFETKGNDKITKNSCQPPMYECMNVLEYKL